MLYYNSNKQLVLEQTELFNILDRRCPYFDVTTFDDFMDIITDIRNAGFHKIPEGAVILTKQEYFLLKNIKKAAK